MTEIIVPKCPRCGADIELRPDGEAGVCRYCDAQVLVLDNAPHPSESEIERRKEALALLRQDLAELQLQAAVLQNRIRAAEAGGTPANARAAVFPMVLFSMMALFGAFMTVLFYILDISWVYGVPRSMCPAVGAVVVIIGVAGILGSRAASKKLRELRRARALQSPEYTDAVGQYQALQPRILSAQQEVDRADKQLRALVLGPQTQ